MEVVFLSEIVEGNVIRWESRVAYSIVVKGKDFVFIELVEKNEIRKGGL